MLWLEVHAVACRLLDAATVLVQATAPTSSVRLPPATKAATTTTATIQDSGSTPGEECVYVCVGEGGKHVCMYVCV